MAFLLSTLALTTVVPFASPAFTLRDCSARHIGAGSVPVPDTPEAFEDLQAFHNAAKAAQTPAGYVQSYSDQSVTYNDADLYLSYKDLDKYDAGECASNCNSLQGCNAFNIFFERGPIVNPGPSCPNPTSTTVIKCTLWSGTILSETSLNHGQYRENFKVLMAGSNAYVKQAQAPTTQSFPGYKMEGYPPRTAIQAPSLDCYGKDTYLGVRYWKDGKLDIQRCLDVCTRSELGCNFVNTYIQLKNEVPSSQHCAMYNARWPAKYATNEGQLRSSNATLITISNSYGFTKVDGNNYDVCEPTTNS